MPDGGRVGTTQDRISDSRAEVSTVRASSQWAKQPNYRDCEAPSQIQAELLNWWVGVVWIELEIGSSHLERNRISKQLQNPLRLQLRRPTAKGRAVVMSTTWAAARRSKPTPQRSNSPQGRKTTRALACWDTTKRAGAADEKVSKCVKGLADEKVSKYVKEVICNRSGWPKWWKMCHLPGIFSQYVPVKDA